MGGHLPRRRDAARLCRADRHQRQHHHPRQGHPPRVPPRRGRSVQQRPGQAARATASSRSAIFQENFEIEQSQGSAPDRVILGVEVEEQRDRRAPALGRLLEPRALPRQPVDPAAQLPAAAARSCAPSINYSSYSKSIELGFTEPYLFDRNIAVGFDLFRRDLNSFNFFGNERNTTYEQVTHRRPDPRGRAADREHVARAALRPQLRRGRRSTRTLYSPIPTAPGRCPPVCDPLIAGRYLCDAIGNRLTSSHRLFAGLRHAQQPHPADPRRAARAQPGFRRPRRRRALSAHARSAPPNIGTSSATSSSRCRPRAATSTASRTARPSVDPVRLTDRFFLGNPQIRGFDIRGVGPRVQRAPYLYDHDADRHRQPTSASPTIRNTITDDAIGGRAYYLGRAELEIPLGASVRELGLRPSVFVDVGAVFGACARRTLLDIDRRAARSRISPVHRRPQRRA